MTEDDTTQEVLGMIAQVLEKPKEEIDPNASLVDLGMDSLYLFQLAGLLEDKWGLQADPALLYDMESVSDLVYSVQMSLKEAGKDPGGKIDDK